MLTDGFQRDIEIIDAALSQLQSDRLLQFQACYVSWQNKNLKLNFYVVHMLNPWIPCGISFDIGGVILVDDSAL